MSSRGARTPGSIRAATPATRSVPSTDNGGPGHATELLITYIYKAGFGQTRFDYAAALTVVQFLLLVVLTVIANRLSGGNAGSLER